MHLQGAPGGYELLTELAAGRDSRVYAARDATAPQRRAVLRDVHRHAGPRLRVRSTATLAALSLPKKRRK